MKVVLFGATGLIGGAVLNVSLQRADVEEVLVIGRRTCGMAHPKLTEILHDDFTDYARIAERLAGFDACFFALGVSSFRMSEENYSRITYDFAVAAAETLARLNPNMVFCFVSGLGADDTMKSMQMWARVKGKTEVKLKTMPFKNVFVFRPGYIQPDRNAGPVPALHAGAALLFPVWKRLFPRYVSTATQIAEAMINSVNRGGDNATFESADIVSLAGAGRG